MRFQRALPVWHYQREIVAAPGFSQPFGPQSEAVLGDEGMTVNRIPGPCGKPKLLSYFRQIRCEMSTNRLCSHGRQTVGNAA
jgi:hypothetical protein